MANLGEAPNFGCGKDFARWNTQETRVRHTCLEARQSMHMYYGMEHVSEHLSGRMVNKGYEKYVRLQGYDTEGTSTHLMMVAA